MYEKKGFDITKKYLTEQATILYTKSSVLVEGIFLCSAKIIISLPAGKGRLLKRR